MKRSLPLDQHLAAAPEVAHVMAHARLLMRAGRLYEKMVPGMLGSASRLANIKNGVVHIHADNGAVAAKLRQMSGRLYEEFARRGIECQSVEIRVQPLVLGPPPAEKPQRPLSLQAFSSVENTMAGLPEGSDLRAALGNLLAHVARKPGG